VRAFLGRKGFTGAGARSSFLQHRERSGKVRIVVKEASPPRRQPGFPGASFFPAERLGGILRVQIGDRFDFGAGRGIARLYREYKEAGFLTVASRVHAPVRGGGTCAFRSPWRRTAVRRPVEGSGSSPRKSCRACRPLHRRRGVGRGAAVRRAGAVQAFYRDKGTCSGGGRRLRRKPTGECPGRGGPGGKEGSSGRSGSRGPRDPGGDAGPADDHPARGTFRWITGPGNTARRSGTRT